MCRVLGLLRQSPELAIFALQELMQGNAGGKNQTHVQ